MAESEHSCQTAFSNQTTGGTEKKAIKGAMTYEYNPQDIERIVSKLLLKC